MFSFCDSPERGRNAARKRMNNMCTEITGQMDVYGTAGQGSKLKLLIPFCLMFMPFC